MIETFSDDREPAFDPNDFDEFDDRMPSIPQGVEPYDLDEPPQAFEEYQS